MNKKVIAGKKRWQKVSKKERSKQMKEVRGSLDFSKIKLPNKPKDIKTEVLTEIANETKKGLEYGILLSLSDKKTRTQKEIQQLLEKITIVAAIELNRRDGLMEVSKNFDWFTNWKVKQKAMICPSCGHRWVVKMKIEFGKCPNCGIDIIKLAERMFPNLKKLKEKLK